MRTSDPRRAPRRCLHSTLHRRGANSDTEVNSLARVERPGVDARPRARADPAARRRKRSDARAYATAKTSQVSLKDGASRAAARTPLAPASRTRRAEQDSAGKSSPGFFKTRAGSVALAVMVVGVGYALYSAQDDRITSPAKQ